MNIVFSKIEPSESKSVYGIYCRHEVFVYIANRHYITLISLLAFTATTS